ncbi:IS3 family transposase [Persicobacter sp. CCB-QB2]|uniref:IS3 family transposase n=1 Tax=Persicobacter sp. CCB-QB2 TaxID=1561025 RepID=UPI0012F84E28
MSSDERAEIARKYTGLGLKRDKAILIAQITKHKYYYQPTKERKHIGRKATTTTQRGHSVVPNEDVIGQIKCLKEDPITDYGYRMMTSQLKLEGYNINHKKVFRLMKEADLLQEKRKVSDKNYVKYRCVCPERPLQVLEMDIKMVWVTEHRRHAYILSIIDTFTRVILDWSVGYQMDQKMVIKAWERVIENYLQPNDLLKQDLHVELRNDNGSQFSAKSVQEFLRENSVHQTFTHPYTPQENGHIESFHSILKKGLGQEPFWNLEELRERLEVFYEKYNNVRLHGSIAHLSPNLFWKAWEYDLIERTVINERKVKFRLTVPHSQLSGIMSQREVLCSNMPTLNGEGYLNEDVNGPNTPNSLQPSVN